LIFFYFLKLSLFPKIWSIVEKMPGLQRRMCIGNIFCKSLWSPFGLLCHFVSFNSEGSLLIFFFLSKLPIYWWEWENKIFLYIVLRSTYACKSSIVFVNVVGSAIICCVLFPLLIWSELLCPFWLIFVLSLLYQKWV
jgi:hypothetical protein